MSDRALIIARMKPENAASIAGLFADSDTPGYWSRVLQAA